MHTQPIILDTTLRDGSYAVDFSFTAHDTFVLCRELEAAGIQMIEIGHGVGLGASEKGHGQSAATDEEYMEAARRALTRAKFGMFCIPGIAGLEHIDLAHRYRMDFVRVGTDVTAIETSEPFIRKAKDYGMFVAANYMKSYVLSPSQFAERVRLSESYGADVIYVVDSAGGMLPEAITTYYDAIRQCSDIPLGFHAHDNLGMAVGNSLLAVRSGYQYVDASLQGLGRSSGNACTEILVAVLEKAGITTELNLMSLLRTGQRLVNPLISRRGEMPLDVVAGLADFHSSYMPKILKAAGKYGIEPERLIVEFCKINKTDVPVTQLEQVAMLLSEQASAQRELFVSSYGRHRYVGEEQDIDNSRNAT